MKLYYAPGACSMAPHIVALEAGLHIDLVKIDVKSKKTEHDDDFLRINPKGYVPALMLDDGEVITEAGVVCQYLADQKPDSNLIAPWGSLQRYHDMSMLNFVATEVHKQLGALFHSELAPEMKEVQKSSAMRRLDTVEEMLTGKSYVMGDRFTVTDAYLFTVLNWTRALKIDLGQWPDIQTYVQRVRAREKVKQAMIEEGLHR